MINRSQECAGLWPRCLFPCAALSGLINRIPKWFIKHRIDVVLGRERINVMEQAAAEIG